MKRLFISSILFLCLHTLIYSQANHSYIFSISGCNVIAYKQGTSCTASAYSFYLINDAGVQASTPFYTISNTSREVNGIGINPLDRFLYGIEYDRDGACAFSNFHLMRYDTQGSADDLGTLPSPAGGSVSGALGCITNNGNFIYSTKDSLGNTCLSMIAAIASLSSNPGGTLPLYSCKTVTNNASNYSYADWAVHPSNSKIYTYGIANIGGVSTGKVLALDPATGVLQSSGIADGSSFLDPARDNFGGVYFGSDGMLYGVNVNTRKLYKIDVITGSTTYISTMSGSGQIRADMGSYTTGWITLPVRFEKIEWQLKDGQNFLSWQVANANDIRQFVVEKTNNGTFVEASTLLLTDADKKTTVFNLPVTGSNQQWRIKAEDESGKFYYSPVIYKKSSSLRNEVQLVSTIVSDGNLRLLPNESGESLYHIVSMNGQQLKSGTLSFLKNAVSLISLGDLPKGMYLLKLSQNGQALKFAVE